MLKQRMSHKMLQKLSPQQIQLMKLLQIPTATLDQRIQEELEANPALDETTDQEEERKEEELYDEKKEENDESSDEEFELDAYLQEYIDDDPTSYKLKGDSYTAEEEKAIPIALERSFHEHLDKQIGMLNLKNENDLQIARQIVGSIDEDGYLRREPEAIVDDLMFSQNIDITIDDIRRILKKVKQFDPPGIGASDLKECLTIQLIRNIDKINDEQKDDEQRDVYEVSLKILEKYFEEFTKKHYQKLKKYLNLSDSELKEAIELILKLNPKPASGLQQDTANTRRLTQYVVPDFSIANREGELELTLNNKNAPDLRINDHYMEMLQNYKVNTQGRRSSKKEREAVLFIKQKIDSAKWFIDAIKQRQDTLYRTMYTIMQYQYDYFLSGDQRKLKPMILKDIAEVTNLDISTISRVANSKFVQTEFGTKKIKSFFSESLTTQDGKEVSTFEVKNILADIIKGEEKKKPLSDEKLKNMLLDKGYNIARRTVAKYREQLNIPVARLRREL